MSDLERTFDYFWRVLGGPELTKEHRFLPDRRFRFDRAFLPARVAIEIDGGTWGMGRHNRPAGFAADCEKINLAQLHGWRVFRFTSDMIMKNPSQLAPIIALCVPNE